MSKIKSVIIFAVMGVALLLVAVFSETTTDQIQSSVWRVNDTQQKWEFSNNTLYVQSSDQTYDYIINRDNNIEIKDGAYKGTYALKNDAKNYRLIPLHKDNQEIKLTQD